MDNILIIRYILTPQTARVLWLKSRKGHLYAKRVDGCPTAWLTDQILLADRKFMCSVAQNLKNNTSLSGLGTSMRIQAIKKSVCILITHCIELYCLKQNFSQFLKLTLAVGLPALQSLLARLVWGGGGEDRKYSTHLSWTFLHWSLQRSAGFLCISLSISTSFN